MNAYKSAIYIYMRFSPLESGQIPFQYPFCEISQIEIITALKSILQGQSREYIWNKRNNKK